MIENLVPWRRTTALTSDPFVSEPLSTISSLQREMNRMFNNLWAGPSIGQRRSAFSEVQGMTFVPDIEMSESDGHIFVSAEIPGVSEKDIDVTLSPDGTMLSIRGEKKLAKEKREKDYYCSEREYGEFVRSLSLTTPVDENKIGAKFHNGVLEIDLTKAEGASQGVKHIPVKSS